MTARLYDFPNTMPFIAEEPATSETVDRFRVNEALDMPVSAPAPLVDWQNFDSWPIARAARAYGPGVFVLAGFGVLIFAMGGCALIEMWFAR